MDDELGELWRGKYRRQLLIGASIIVGGVILSAVVLRPSTSTGWATFTFGCVVSGGLGGLVLLSSGRFFCPVCKKHVPARLPWICGYCDSSNEGFFWHSAIFLVNIFF